MKALNYLTVAFTAMFFLGVCTSNSYSQCSGCTITQGEGSSGEIDVNGNETICVTGTSTFGIRNANGSNNVICVAPGATWSPATGSNYSNMTIDVYGTFNVSNLAGNGAMVINVKSGGVLNFEGNDIPRSYTINNEGVVNFTLDGSINVEGNLYNTTTTSIVSARGGDNTLLKFSSNKVTNVGLLDVVHLENSHTAPFLNEGRVLIQGVLYQHGAIVNRGTIETQCGVTTAGAGYPACSFIVGDKNLTDFINDGGRIVIEGNTTIGGQINMNGGDIVITEGDLIVNKLITGTGGITVLDGNASVSSSGAIGGSVCGNISVHVASNVTGNYDFHTNESNENRNNTYCYTVSSTPLPVKLIAFNVSVSGQEVVLDWVTTVEVNSKEFVVEKSNNLKDWKEIATIEAAGESVDKQSYQYRDNSQSAEIVYYRLRIVDRDGSVEMSPYRSVNIITKKESYIFPNPTSDILHLAENNLDTIEKVFIYTASGSVISTFKAPIPNEMNLQHLGVGNYLIRIMYVDKSMKVFPFVIAK